MLLITRDAVDGLPSKVCRFLAAQISFKAVFIRNRVTAFDRTCWASVGRPCFKRTKGGEKPAKYKYNYEMTTGLLPAKQLTRLIARLQLRIENNGTFARLQNTIMKW